MTAHGTVPASAAGHRPDDRLRTDLAVLTGTKLVSNTALRWVGPFLPTLERAFSASTGTLTGIMGICELGGLSTAATGPLLDRGRERRVCVVGLTAVSASSFVALTGSVTGFAVSFALLILGVSNLTVAGHAWIGHRIVFTERSRAIGWYETSWAVSLLLGAPLVAWSISVVGWRGPYVLLGIGAAIGALVVLTVMTPDVSTDRIADRVRTRLPPSAWAPMTASAATAAAGLGIYVVSGAWLDEAHGIGTAGLGVVAAGFGIVELASSGTVIALGDRIGARRSVLVGLGLLGTGLATMAALGDDRWSAIVGLLVFLCGFEFAFVSSLTLVTEAAPESRGRAIGISNAMATIARSSAVVASGQFFEAFGMGGSLALAATAWIVATTATLITPRH